MARPLRIEYPGACYHIMNRGNQRMQVFYDKSHYDLFLEKLEAFSEQYHVLIRCYCLMPNHFHLYIETEEANLIHLMQSFLTSFVIFLNRLRGSRVMAFMDVLRRCSHRKELNKIQFFLEKHLSQQRECAPPPLRHSIWCCNKFFLFTFF